jgi:ferritin-like protein
MLEGIFMAASSASFHESLDKLSSETQDLHRAIVSLQEELEAADWYRQRADACGDEELKAILLHNMREEIEHAAMILEWLRRNNADFSQHLKTYLFTTQPIMEVEEEDTAGETSDSTTNPDPEPVSGPSLTIGDMKGK